MDRVAVVGCSGSGKTTTAKALADVLDCAYVELDAIFHQPDWTELDGDTFRQRVTQLVQAPRWVVDGNYSVVQDLVWEPADTVVWFDLPFLVVMSRVIRRTIRRVVLRTELWNGNKEPLSNLFSIKPEKSIIAWSATRHRVYRRRYAADQCDPRWSGRTFVRLRSTRDVRQFVRTATRSETGAS